jgi:hypothetical protein
METTEDAIVDLLILVPCAACVRERALVLLTGYAFTLIHAMSDDDLHICRSRTATLLL